ncbi:MAG: hypothetical protein JO131_02115 [Gammaproteobacteria bacterium]|nr:hypothetical protein [Gammaproteobacteria bacterium]
MESRFTSFLKECIPPIEKVILWQGFTGAILLISRYETGIEDILMYLPAAVAALDDIRRNKSRAALAQHAILATAHNLQGHRFLPYIDPKLGYQCKISPFKDVVYHGAMLGFVDYKVQNKFSSPFLNNLYKVLSIGFKIGILHSSYLAWNFESDLGACKNFAPSLAHSSIPAGTMFSLLTMWEFPFDNCNLTVKQRNAYLAIMYLVSFSIPLVMLYTNFENKTDNTFEFIGSLSHLASGKYFESYFIAGESLKGMMLIKEFFSSQIFQLGSTIQNFSGKLNRYKIDIKENEIYKTNTHQNKHVFVKASSSSHSVSQTLSTSPERLDAVPRVSACRRFGLFALNVTTAAAVTGVALYNFMYKS